MSLSNPRSIFGVCSFSPYKRTDGLFYGELRVLQNSSIALSSELISLQGGCNPYDWSVEVGQITAEMSLSFSEYPDFVFEIFGGNAPTSNAAEASGSVTALTNKLGTLVEATTGAASIGIEAGNEADLKFGKYVLKVLTTTTVAVYYSSDVDIGRGVDGEYVTDDLKIIATLTVPNTGATVSVTNFGLEITGGSGTIDFTTAGAVGDTATFDVRPPNSASMDVTIGKLSSQNFVEFGAIVMAAKQSDGQMFELDALRCKAGGLPIGFAANEYSPAEVTVKLLYDSVQDGVYKIRHVTPTTA
jgi:hypothetical protein